MKLRQTIIDELLRNRPLRFDLAIALGFGEVWTDRLIIANKNNGPLTTAASLLVLRKELNKTDDEILENVSEVKEDSVNIVSKNH